MSFKGLDDGRPLVEIGGSYGNRHGWTRILRARREHPADKRPSHPYADSPAGIARSRAASRSGGMPKARA